MIDPAHLHLLFSFIFGMLLGSFLNVCIYRIPLEKSIVYPPSSCPHCSVKIRFYDNIPLVSYLLLMGRCRSCRSGISIRYPVVELATGLLSTALFAKYGFSVEYPALLAFCSALLVIAFIDIDHKIIPDVISVPGIVVGFGLSFLPMTKLSVLESAIGIVAGGGVLYLVGFLFELIRRKEGMGLGDVKLLAMIGAWMGWKSLPMIILISSLTGSLIGGACLLVAGRKLTEHIPFGPFLVLGALLCLFFEREIYHFWNGYLRLIY